MGICSIICVLLQYHQVCLRTRVSGFLQNSARVIGRNSPVLAVLYQEVSLGRILAVTCIILHKQRLQKLTLKVLVTTIDAQWEGMGDVGSARYEPAPLPPCPTLRVLSYSN